MGLRCSQEADPSQCRSGLNCGNDNFCGGMGAGCSTSSNCVDNPVDLSCGFDSAGGPSCGVLMNEFK